MFYLTIPSNGYDITYPENTPAKFKAKLVKEIFLPENDWKEAMSIISFPSTLSSVIRDDVNYQLLVGLDFMCGMELNMDGVKDADGLYIGNKSYLLKGGRMKYEYGSKRRGLSTSRDGVDFWNRMIALPNYRLHNRLPYKASDHTVVDKDLHKKNFKWPEFKWENVGGTYRLKIDNGGIIKGDYRSGIENAFFIHLDIAKAFNLVVPRKDGKSSADDLGYELTSLVSAEHFRDPISQVVHVNDDQKLWSIRDSKAIGFKPEGTQSKSKFLKLDCSVNWYFYELGHAYHSSLHQKRPLYVNSDLVQTQFVGKSETDLLIDVEFDGSTDGNTVKNTYEPQNLQFIPIRKKFFASVEIGISEIDGTQTQFLGSKNESTVVTLCFRRRGII